MRLPFYIFCLLPVTLMAAVPLPLTNEEMAGHERLVEPVSASQSVPELNDEERSLRELHLKPIGSLENLDKETRDLNDKADKESERVNALMKEFMDRSELPSGELLAVPIVAEVKPAPKKDAVDNQDKTPGEEPPMVITSKDGMYFDSEAGLLVYLRDVVLTDPRFNLTCDNQLKIYLERDNTKAKKADEKKAENSDKADKSDKEKEGQGMKTPDTANLNFSGVKNIAASGNVVVTRKNESGQMMEARAEKATYDGKTGEIILSGGGKQSIKDGENLVETSGDGSYIRMYGNGSVRVVGKQTITKVRTSDEKGQPLKMKKK